MDSVSKNLEKVGKSLYDLFDNSYIKIIVITILVIYSSGLFVDFNLQLSSIFNNTIIRLILLIIVVAISQKNVTIAMLLILALALSSYYRKDSIEGMTGSENGKDTEEKDMSKQQEKVEGERKERRRRPPPSSSSGAY